MQRFEDLEVWQDARRIANRIYDLSDVPPFSRDYGLKDQIRRAAVSAMSNIAEGFECRTDPMYLEYLSRAKNSAGETRSQLYICLDRKYVTEQDFEQTKTMVESCSKQIGGLMKHIQEDMSRARRRGAAALTVAFFAVGLGWLFFHLCT